MGWVILITLAGFLTLPIVPWVLQRRGVAWTYRVGIPVATYWRDSAPAAAHSDDLILEERDDATLIRERRPIELFKWSAGVVGRIEQVGQQTRLKFVTDWHATLVWCGALFQGSIVLVVLPLAPEIRDPATSWPHRIGLFLMAAAIAGLVAGILVWARRRARTKSARYANALGFS